MIFTKACADVVDSADPTASSSIISFLPLIVIFVIFYFFVIRPQHKKVKDHNTMIDSVSRGDKVVTSGGIVAKITKVDTDNDCFFVEIAEGVEVKIQKSYIVSKGEKNNEKK